MSYLNFIDIIKTLLGVFAERMQLRIIYPGLIMAVLGLACSFLARRITSVVKKTNEIKDNDRVLLSIKALGLVLIFLSMIYLIVQLSK